MKCLRLFSRIIMVVVALALIFAGCERHELTPTGPATPDDTATGVSFRLHKSVADLAPYRIQLRGDKSVPLAGIHQVPYDKDLRILVWNTNTGVREIQFTIISNGTEYPVEPSWVDPNNRVHCLLTFKELKVEGIVQQSPSNWVQVNFLFQTEEDITAASVFPAGGWELKLALNGNVWSRAQDLITGVDYQVRGVMVLGQDGTAVYVYQGLAVNGVDLDQGTIIRSPDGRLQSWTWNITGWEEDGKPILSGESFSSGDIVIVPDDVEPDIPDTSDGGSDVPDGPTTTVEVNELKVIYLPAYGVVQLQGADAEKDAEGKYYQWEIVFFGNPAPIPPETTETGWGNASLNGFKSSAGFDFEVGGLRDEYREFLFRTADGRWINSANPNINLINVETLRQENGDLWFKIDRTGEVSKNEPLPAPPEKLIRLHLKEDGIYPNPEDVDWIEEHYPRLLGYADEDVAAKEDLDEVYLEWNGVCFPLPPETHYHFVVFRDNGSAERIGWSFAILAGPNAEFESTSTIRVEPNGSSFTILAWVP